MFSQELDFTDMETRLARWLQAKMPEARGVAVSGLKRASAGFSNETFFFDAAWQDEEGHKAEPTVLRRQPRDVVLFPDYDLEKQCRIMERLANTDVPVPRVHWFEHDTSVLGSPFYLMSKIDGEIAPEVPPYHSFGLFYDATPERRRNLCLSGLEVAARIHLLDWKRLGFGFLGAPSPATTEALDRELDYYENFLEWAREEPQPILQAALDYLRENKFVPERIALCWGDCRVGNMIFDDNDEVVGVLDWEMAYLAFKFGVIMVKVVKNMKANKTPIAEDWDVNNPATRRLASLLELPPPGAQRQRTNIDEITAVIQTHITGPGGFSWYLVAEKGVGTRHEGTTDNPDAMTTMSFETWKGIQSGELNRVEAFMGGLIQVEGDVTLLMQFEDMLNRLGGSAPEA